MSFSKRPGLRVGVAIVVLGVAMPVSSSALGQTVRLGNLIATINGGFAPKRLPKHRPAPIKLRVQGAIDSADGTHVPPLKALKVDFDRHGHLFTKGLPSCRVHRLESTLTAQAKRMCGKALVGTGRVTAEIAFPEQKPFSAGGPLLIFNGSHGRRQMLIFHVYAKVPAPTTFVTTARISRLRGRYGTRAFVRIPTITSGQGSLTSFKAKLRRSWRFKHRRRSLLLASCPTGRLFAHGDFWFADGTRIAGNVVRSCKPR